MNNIDNQIPKQIEKPVAYWIILFVLYLAMTGFSTAFIIQGLLAYIFNNAPETAFLFLTQPQLFEGKQMVFVSIMALNSMFIYIGGSYFFIKRENGFVAEQLQAVKNTFDKDLVLKIALLTLCAYPTFLLLSELNKLGMEMILPDNILELLLQADKKATGTYEYLLSVKETPTLLLSIVGLAIIPGIGEELVFRGVFQNLFKKAFRSPHLAIWISAFLFSAIHLEWANFILRLLLGGLFGYFYYWTKNIYVPIVAHVTYNTSSLVIGYLVTNNFIDASMDTSLFDNNAWLYIAIYSIVPIALIYLFHKKTKGNVI